MRCTKKNFLFLIFLCVVFSINGKATPLNCYADKNENNKNVLLSSVPDQEKSELAQLESIVHASFRLVENTNVFFQNLKNTNSVFHCAFNEQVFLQQQFSCYTTKRLNRLRNSLLYLYHRRLLI